MRLLTEVATALLTALLALLLWLALGPLTLLVAVMPGPDPREIPDLLGFLILIAIVERTVHWLVYTRRSPGQQAGDGWRARLNEAATTSATSGSFPFLITYLCLLLLEGRSGLSWDIAGVNLVQWAALSLLLALSVFLARGLMQKAGDLGRWVLAAAGFAVLVAGGLVYEQASLAAAARAELVRRVRAPSAPPPGYVWRYHAGPAKGPAAPSTYALTAVPEEAGGTGNRGFCVDSTGAIRYTTDATAPKVVDGVCDPALPY